MTAKEIETVHLKRLISEIQVDLEAVEKICAHVSDLYGQIQEEPTVKPVQTRFRRSKVSNQRFGLSREESCALKRY